PREPLPKRRIEQEEEIVALEPAKPAAASCDGDVLELFESSLSAAEMHPVPEAAAPEEDMAELLAPDMLKTEAVVQKPTALQPMKPRHTPQESPTARLDAAARMRAAAREELKRAAAAMSAPLMRPHPPHKSPDERSLQELGGDELLNSG
ncbi:MAG TPA: hypothetical protein VHK24_12250, partial [Steroidobacter sp.]|nr:hypothetical protein [Steroidobacter sp.]